MNPNEPPKEIKEDLNALVAMMKEYVYYKYPYIDKLDRIEYMQRDIVCVSDKLLSHHIGNYVLNNLIELLGNAKA